MQTASTSDNQHPLKPVSRLEYLEVDTHVNLHLTDMGDGPPIVLIHGWPLSDAMYEYQYTALIEAGYRAIGIGLRGYGLSDKPYGNYDYDVFINDIRVVLEKLNIYDAVLGGFSMGGAIATYFVAKYGKERVKKLALFGAAGPSWTKRSDFPYGLDVATVNELIELGKTNRPALVDRVGKIFASREDALPTGIGAWLAQINLMASPYATVACLETLRDTDLRSELHKIELPTIILHGRKDKIVDFALGEQMQKGIKDSKLVPFENSGHALFYEEKEKFNQELLHFLSE